MRRILLKSFAVSLFFASTAIGGAAFACDQQNTALRCGGVGPAVILFKVITVKDEIVVGITPDQWTDWQGGAEASNVAKALAEKGSLKVWQYAVKKAANGDLQQAPLQQIGLLSNASLRVEPYKTPLAILWPDMIVAPKK